MQTLSVRHPILGDPDTLFVGDFQVLCHKVHNAAQSVVAALGSTGDDSWRTERINNAIRANWSLLLNRVSSEIPLGSYKLALVNDLKVDGKYWRHDLFPDYKGNRSGKPAAFNAVVHTGLEVASKLGFCVLSEPRFEADDLAAWLCRYYTGKIALWSIDTDWLQLVNARVTWLNTAHYKPVIRDEQEVIDWAKRRHKYTLTNAREIVDMKVALGDSSDNLPRGADRCLIDLHGIPSEHQATLDINKEKWLGAVATTARTSPEWYEKAALWLQLNGFPREL